MVLLPRASAASVIPVVMKLSEANGRVQTIPLKSLQIGLTFLAGAKKGFLLLVLQRRVGINKRSFFLLLFYPTISFTVKNMGPFFQEPRSLLNSFEISTFDRTQQVTGTSQDSGIVVTSFYSSPLSTLWMLS